jgi:aminomethyltransferase
LFVDETSSQAIGRISSGGFGPTVSAPVAMGYVPTEYAKTGTKLFAEVRGSRLPVKTADLPFITPGYKRS